MKGKLRTRIIVVLVTVLPVAGVSGGAIGIAIHSRQRYQLTASRLRSRWRAQREEGQSTAILTGFEEELHQLGTRRVAGLPAIWFAKYDGVGRQLIRLQQQTTQTWQKTLASSQAGAQISLTNLEKTMGKFASNHHGQREQQLLAARTPQQYVHLEQQWEQERNDWLETEAKLKAVSGGDVGGRPADVVHFSAKLNSLLKSAPKVLKLDDANVLRHQVARFWKKTPQQQLRLHAALVKKLKTAIAKVEKTEALYREQQANNPFGALFQRYLRGRTSEVSVAIYDASNHKTYLYQPNIHYHTASIVKATIMADLLRHAQVTGKPLTANEGSLMIPMIEESDNSAATKLWDIAGGSTGITSFLRGADMTNTTPGQGGYWGLTSTTVTDQIRLMNLYAFPNSVLDNANRQYGLNLMEHVVGWEDWGVSTGAQGHATIALKNGWLPEGNDNWRINSIGYVDGAGRDYTIAVLSRNNPSEQYGIQTVDEVSQLVWEAIG